MSWLTLLEICKFFVRGFKLIFCKDKEIIMIDKKPKIHTKWSSSHPKPSYPLCQESNQYKTRVCLLPPLTGSTINLHASHFSFRHFTAWLCVFSIFESFQSLFFSILCSETCTLSATFCFISHPRRDFLERKWQMKVQPLV